VPRLRGMWGTTVRKKEPPGGKNQTGQIQVRWSASCIQGAAGERQPDLKNRELTRRYVIFSPFFSTRGAGYNLRVTELACETSDGPAWRGDALNTRGRQEEARSRRHKGVRAHRRIGGRTEFAARRLKVLCCLKVKEKKTEWARCTIYSWSKGRPGCKKLLSGGSQHRQVTIQTNKIVNIYRLEGGFAGRRQTSRLGRDRPATPRKSPGARRWSARDEVSAFTGFLSGES